MNKVQFLRFILHSFLSVKDLFTVVFEISHLWLDLLLIVSQSVFRLINASLSAESIHYYLKNIQEMNVHITFL